MDLNFEITAGGSSVPAGMYRATFDRVEESSHEEFGSGVKWVFKVTEGAHSGEEASRITGDRPTPKNAAGRMISGLSGQAAKPGVRVTLEACVGREFLIQVADAPGGSGTRIETVMPRDV
jgi:hypothetical protein